MHPIWNITELLAYILLFLDEKLDLLQCSLVCRAFSVEAIRLIWKEVDDFHNLLGCFPRDIVSTKMSGPKSEPTRTFLLLDFPNAAEWNHMRSRASMIRELTFSDSDNYDPLLEVIQRHNINLTFPELISLHLYVTVTKRSQSFFPLFSASRLQKLDINFDGSNNRLVNKSMKTLLAQGHPLRRLEIGATSLPDVSQGYLTQLLETTPTIDSLCLMLETLAGEDIVQAAARLPQLRELDLKFTGRDGERTEYSPGFESLVLLDTWGPYTSALAVACAVNSPNMEEVHMSLMGEIVGPRGSLFQRIASMANLKSVSLTFHDSGIPQWADVEPILSCRFISKFSIMLGPFGLEVDDQVLRAIIHAWPNLTYLRLGGLYDNPSRFTRPSLYGLGELLLRCPRLEELILEVDARARPFRVEVTNELRAILQPRGRLLFDVRRSLILQGSEVNISEFLMTLWPGECDVISEWRDEWEGDAWETVRELMQQRE
ncbi:hypothetical protein FRC00_010661 [Tulasnella sp. 408]|nr:hypothetical protein FRC00_010661 [Tulasnella sp. 408]